MYILHNMPLLKEKLSNPTHAVAWIDTYSSLDWVDNLKKNLVNITKRSIQYRAQASGFQRGEGPNWGRRLNGANYSV